MGGRALTLLPGLLALTPLVIVPGWADFARFPQRVFIDVWAVVLVVLWAREGSSASSGQAKPLDLPLGLFLGWSALSLVWSPSLASGLEILAHWGSCALVYGVVSRRVATPAEARPLLAGLFAGGVGVALVGLAQALLHIDVIPSAVGPAGTLANRNAAAGHLVTVLPLGLALWRAGGMRGRRAVVAGAAVILVFLPFTLARVAAVALAIQLLALRPAASPRGRPGLSPRASGLRRVAPYLAALAVVLSAVALTLAVPAKARSVSIRASLGQAAVSMASEAPLLGIGFEGYGERYPAFGEPIFGSDPAVPLVVGSAHNEALQVLAETGLPGLLALVWLATVAASILARLRRSQSPEVRATAWALGLSLIGLATDGAFGFPLRTSLGPLVAAVLLGLLGSLDAGESPLRFRREAPVLPRVVPVALAVLLLLVSPLAWSVHGQSAPPGPLSGAPQSSECGPSVHLTVRANGRFDFLATDVPLSEVLDCLAARTELRVETDGPPPRRAVSADIVDGTLGQIVTELLTGLGVDYLLGFDPSGKHLERVMLVGASSPAGRPRPAGERERSPGPVGTEPRERGPWSTPDAEESAGEPEQRGIYSSPGTAAPYRGPRRNNRAPGYEPGLAEPAELSPMTLRRPLSSSSTTLARSGHAPSGM